MPELKSFCIMHGLDVDPSCIYICSALHMSLCLENDVCAVCVSKRDIHKEGARRDVQLLGYQKIPTFFVYAF